MGKEIEHFILLPGVLLKYGDLILHWQGLVFDDVHMESIEVLFTHSYWGKENFPIIHVRWGDDGVPVQPLEGGLNSLPEKEGEEDDHHESVEEKNLFHNRVKRGLSSFRKYILWLPHVSCHYSDMTIKKIQQDVKLFTNISDKDNPSLHAWPWGPKYSCSKKKQFRCLVSDNSFCLMRTLYCFCRLNTNFKKRDNSLKVDIKFSIAKDLSNLA